MKILKFADFMQILHVTRQEFNGPQASNLSQQQFKKIWSKIFDFFGGENKNLKKHFEKKISKFFFSTSSTLPSAHPVTTSSTLPSAHPVQISSHSDYCITLS